MMKNNKKSWHTNEKKRKSSDRGIERAMNVSARKKKTSYTTDKTTCQPTEETLANSNNGKQTTSTWWKRKERKNEAKTKTFLCLSICDRWCTLCGQTYNVCESHSHTRFVFISLFFSPFLHLFCIKCSRSSLHGIKTIFVLFEKRFKKPARMWSIRRDTVDFRTTLARIDVCSFDISKCIYG